MNDSVELTIGTRGSALARWQTDWVSTALQARWPGLRCHIVLLQTQGDRIADRPLPEIGGKGLFTAELEAALRSGAIDLAVHSLKDLPVDDAEGLTISAIPARANPWDVLVTAAGYTVSTLPAGAVVGTSSLRRRAQLLAVRPDLQIESLRGNVDTRLRKAANGPYAAIVLAAAGIERLGHREAISQVLPADIMLPAPGQGALAVQTRRDDERVLALVSALHDAETAAAVGAERAFLKELDAGCRLPVAAYARVDGKTLSVQGVVASVDGQRLVRVRGAGPLADYEGVGQALADQARRWGADAILSAQHALVVP